MGEVWLNMTARLEDLNKQLPKDLKYRMVTDLYALIERFENHLEKENQESGQRLILRQMGIPITDSESDEEESSDGSETESADEWVDEEEKVNVAEFESLNLSSNESEDESVNLSVIESEEESVTVSSNKSVAAAVEVEEQKVESEAETDHIKEEQARYMAEFLRLEAENELKIRMEAQREIARIRQTEYNSSSRSNTYSNSFELFNVDNHQRLAIAVAESKAAYDRIYGTEANDSNWQNQTSNDYQASSGYQIGPWPGCYEYFENPETNHRNEPEVEANCKICKYNFSSKMDKDLHVCECPIFFYH